MTSSHSEQAAAGAGRSRWWLLPASLGLGVLVGRLSIDAAPEHVFREAGPVAAVPPLGAPLPAALPSFADVVQRAMPGVVSVQATVAVTDLDDDAAERLAGRVGGGVLSGTGFVVNDRGCIVTARHLVRAASRIGVEFGRFGVVDAEVVGEDELTDIAVLRLVQKVPNLTVLELGPSEDLRAGDWIVALGNPLGYKQTVTAGIVSYVGRHLPQYDLRVTNDFLQFSAQVNQGSSGSPVLDLQGRVVGVTTQAAGKAQGISFAIPSRTLKWVLDQMDKSRDGRVHRGYLGISFDSRRGSDERGRPLEGAQVLGVAEGEPAHQAGLQRGDVVLFVDDHRIADASDLYERITRAAPGTHARMTLLRDGKVLEPVAVVLRDALPATKDKDADLSH